MTYQITRQQMANIHSVACDKWQEKLTAWANANPFEDKISLGENQVQEMFNAADTKQKRVLKSIFPKFSTNPADKIKNYNSIREILGDDFEDEMYAKGKRQQAANALVKLCNIAAAYNKLRKLKVDWNNKNQIKYYSYYNFDLSRLRYGGGNYSANYPAGVVFLNKDDLLDAQEKFKIVFETYHMI